MRSSGVKLIESAKIVIYLHWFTIFNVGNVYTPLYMYIRTSAHTHTCTSSQIEEVLVLKPRAIRGNKEMYGTVIELMRGAVVWC